MKRPMLVVISCLLIVFCWGRSSSRADEVDAEETGYSDRTIDEELEDDTLDGREYGLSSALAPSSSTKTHQLIDARTGLVVNSTEYPSNWNVISKPSYTIDQKLPTFLIQITGPDHLNSFNTPIAYHVDYQDPQMAQLMYNTPYGKMIRPLAGPQQIFNEEVKGRMAKSGFEYLGEREQPEVTRYLRNKIASKSGMDTALSIYNTEWKNSKGQKAMASVSVISMEQPTVSGNMMVWFYTVNYTFVDESAYEKTLELMKEATFSYRENPQWEEYVNRLGQQRARENQRRAQLAAAQHQNRMQARWSAFNAHQDKMKGIWAAQDANHASFMNRNFGAGSDTGQRQFINMINEEETVYNPLTGNNYQVNAGSTEYWMDSDGNYIRNDDLFYTPNGDINLNNREWVRVENAH
ncbi:hypothetical protein K1F50_19090 [Muricauda oceani]|uniref:Uncharacterized protein n=2 Tax=Flagellimonas TaxID=444459 RepID=A0A6G7IYV3_9FLAO|nr:MULTISPECIES: hypothetical protein [Allomuricauda]MBW8244920.1 hypothetical protein [Allomuricauda oceani]MDF0708818.1 hypothetical protein [[Muricauda] okinawensis]QII43580.1 hypothetical protein GVT53_02400 [Allomuricauda oceani]